MFLKVIGFSLGICSVLLLAELSFWLFFALTILLIFFANYSKHFHWLYFMLLGFWWVVFNSYSTLSWQLPKEIENKPISVSGTVINIPKTSHLSTSFLLKLNKLDGKDLSAKPVIKLNWYGKAPKLEPAQSWHLLVKLKQPHGLDNWGLYDYEKYLFSKKIRATGYVKQSKENRLIHHEWTARPLQYFRFVLLEDLLQRYEALNHFDTILALTLGIKDKISPQSWERYQKTGTSHLIAISGLHIGLIAGFLYFIALKLWCCSSVLVRALPAQSAAGIIAISGAVFYSALAGFSLPTQRACLMLSIFMLAHIAAIRIGVWQCLAIALTLVLCVQPLAVINPGFWLSFLALALIFYTAKNRIHSTSSWRQAGRMHMILAFGLFPVVALFFNQVSLIAPLANAIAIPLVSIFVVPLALGSIALLYVSPILSNTCMQLANYGLELVTNILDILASLPLSTIYLPTPSLTSFFLALIGCIVLLTPKGLTGKWLGIILLLPIFFPSKDSPQPNELWLDIFDVGQGLAILVRTQNHTLVYDAGPKYRTGFDSGKNIITPFLKNHDVTHIDRLLISHLDNDHVGGAKYTFHQIPTHEVLSNQPQKVKWTNAVACYSGLQWQWDGVHFQILHPDLGHGFDRNNASCVLQVHVGKHRILLPGDIEKRIEKKLVKEQRDHLASDILIAPHHGSKSSSSIPFLATVKPQYVVFSTGYLNRYRFPNEEVKSRYSALGTKAYNTAESGAIRFIIQKDAERLRPPIISRNETAKLWSWKADSGNNNNEK